MKETLCEFVKEMMAEGRECPEIHLCFPILFFTFRRCRGSCSLFRKRRVDTRGFQEQLFPFPPPRKKTSDDGTVKLAGGGGQQSHRLLNFHPPSGTVPARLLGALKWIIRNSSIDTTDGSLAL